MSSVDKMESQRQGQTSAYTNYNVFQSRITGAAQITLGALMVLINIIILVAGEDHGSGVGHGIWGGAWIILAGSFGVAAAASKNKCLVITYMTLCILAVVIICPLLILYSGFGIAVESLCNDNDNSETGTTRPTDTDTHHGQTTEILKNIGHGNCQLKLAFHVLMLIFTLLELVCALWGSILSCTVVPCCCPCCCDKNTNATPVQYVESSEVQVKLIESKSAGKSEEKA